MRINLFCEARCYAYVAFSPCRAQPRIRLQRLRGLRGPGRGHRSGAAARAATARAATRAAPRAASQG
eukprot:9397545-Alexandrium_andersonii.AAC.1